MRDSGTLPAKRLVSGLAAISLNTAEPVLGKMMIAGHGVDQHSVIGLHVDELEREARDEVSPRSGRAGFAVRRERGGELRGLFNPDAEAGTKLLAKGFTRQFGTGTRRKPHE